MDLSDKGGPEPSKKIIQNDIFMIGWFHFKFILDKNKSDHTILPGAFRDLDEVCTEVPEDSRVLRVGRLWFPTSNHFETWRILSGTTLSRQYHELTMV